MIHINWTKYIKLILGTVISILLAHLFDLKYAYASGIITLLTIQDTKQETLVIALKRLIIFIVMTMLSLLIFPFLGYTISAFAILLIPYLLFCLLLDMKEAIAPIAVLCTHYISSESCSLPMIGNELMILLIGAGIGVIINLFFQNNLKAVKKKQSLIDERMKSVLKRMAFYITKDDKSLYTSDCFKELDLLLADLREESIRYIHNHFFGKNDYFYDYMQLRLAQCNLLKRIYIDINRLDMVPEHAKPISDFLSAMAVEFHESNNAVKLKNKLAELNAYYDQKHLPATRSEFRNRALLYHILKDLEELVEMKHSFINHSILTSA